ncbi:MAG: hypothetical protein KC636_36525, partial [Myxococcales bacterium]|nr:hypothetical protein [Myxococcales bacterium]
TSVRIVIDGSPRPHLVYDYWIVDDPALAREAPARPKTPPVPGEPPFTVHGNGDGALQPGEAVLLAVRVRNDGPGDAGDVRTLLRNRSGAQALLEEGFFELGAIKAGGAATGAFGISVSDKAIVDKPVELELAVADVGLRESAQHTFELRVVGPREPLRLGQARVQVKEPARIYNAADARASVIGQLAAGELIDVVGETGGWRALALPGGRRGFVPESLVAEAKGKAKAPTLDAAIVTPPRVELDPVETVVAGATITVHGVARHPRKAHDVVVSVKPAGPAQVEKKLFYRANDAREGEALRALEFSAEVPLTPGSNEIYVTARDGDEVEATRVLRVFRDDQAR